MNGFYDDDFSNAREKKNLKRLVCVRGDAFQSLIYTKSLMSAMFT